MYILCASVRKAAIRERQRWDSADDAFAAVPLTAKRG